MHVDRKAIATALKAAGLAQFEKAGVRAARVEDICRQVGIAKGSFYAFYPSKEELFMAIVDERERQHMADMDTFLATPHETANAMAGGFFDLIVRKMETDPVLQLVLTAGEIPHLVRKLGPERFAAGQERDAEFARHAAQLWEASGHGTISSTDLLGLMTIAISMVSQRANMTAQQYDPVVALLRELFIGRLTGALR